MHTTTSFPAVTDRRQRYLGEFLINSGYQVVLAEAAPELDVEAAGYEEVSDRVLVLLPIPAPLTLLSHLKESLTAKHTVLGGNLPKDFIDFCNDRQIACVDYFKNPAIAIENAVATAEGAICQAIRTSEINLHQSQALVIGFGKCGEVLADKLNGLKCYVSVSTRNPVAKSRAKSYGYRLLEDEDYSKFDILFNTAPAMVLPPAVIDKLQSDAVIIDIASSPGGTDFNYCLQKGITAKHCPGIPGKYSPKTSAKILFDQIQKQLKELN